MGFERVFITQGSPSASHGRWRWSRKSIPKAWSKHRRMWIPSKELPCPAAHTHTQREMQILVFQGWKNPLKHGWMLGKPHDSFDQSFAFAREVGEINCNPSWPREDKDKGREGMVPRTFLLERWMLTAHWGCEVPQRNGLCGATGSMYVLKRSRVENKHQKIPLASK